MAVSPSFSGHTLTEDTHAFTQSPRPPKPVPSSSQLAPSLSLRREKQKPGMFQLVVNDGAPLSPPKDRNINIEDDGNEWRGLDLSCMSQIEVENLMRHSDPARKQAKPRPSEFHAITNAWAKQSKEGFVIRLRRKLNKTRDAVAEIHLFQHRATQSKSVQNHVKRVQDRMDPGAVSAATRSRDFPTQSPELDSEPLNELGDTYLAEMAPEGSVPRPELPTDPMRAPSRSHTIFSTASTIAPQEESLEPYMHLIPGSF